LKLEPISWRKRPLVPVGVIAENGEEELFNFSYYFKPESGNLRNRNLHGMTEWFEYDNGTSVKLHRLTGAGLDPDDMDVNYWYSSNGNMVSKSDVGQYTYDPTLGYQVSQIDFEGGVDPDNPLIDMVGHQAVVYNHFNSASLIHDFTSDRKVELFYGPDDHRRMAVYKEGDDEVKTRYYVGAYEKQIDHQNQNNEIRVHYISALGQVVAIYVEDDSEQVTDEGLNGKMYYPHLDHLGSIIHITDANGDIVYTQSFDAWGRTRNPNDLSYNDIPERPDWLWRGYTGHEHLDEFGLINMNGRLYDPVVGRMLSPDNYVQSPDFSQSYNRYSYVWNNPLKYTDPSGEIVFIAPHIGVSSSGSLGIGVSVGVGFPSGLSAQVTVGHSFGNGGNTYATLSASIAGASAYVGYSSQGGAMAGVGFGIGPGMGGFTTNATSAGINWSQKGGFTANASIFSYNQHGGFNVHVSAGYSQGFEVGGNKRLNQTLSDNPHYNDDPDLLAWANGPGDPRKPAKPRAGIDKDVLGDGVRNDGAARMSDIEIGLAVVNSAILTMEQAYRHTNQTFMYASQGRSAAVWSRWSSLHNTKMAWNFKMAGRGVFFLSAGVSVIEGFGNLYGRNYPGAIKSGIDIGIGWATAFGGPIGWTVGAGYYSIEYTMGWENAFQTLDRVNSQHMQSFGRGFLQGPK
jgi:RHS repeat-associated protein